MVHALWTHIKSLSHILLFLFVYKQPFKNIKTIQQREGTKRDHGHLWPKGYSLPTCR